MRDPNWEPSARIPPFDCAIRRSDVEPFSANVGPDGKEEHYPFPVSGREMADLISYLYLGRYLEPVGRVDLGKEVFNEKHCSNCHGADGHGGREGPNLARFQPYYAAQLGYTLWSHGPQMYLHMREKNIPWPSLNEKEIVDLVAFLNSL